MKAQRRLVPLVVIVGMVWSLADPALAQSAPPSAPLGPPLPPAMVRLFIPDVRAFDAALGGGVKEGLYGTLPEDDGVAVGFAQSRVGSKLKDQWSRFRGDTDLSFQTVKDLQATSLALAILDVGRLEIVLVLRTPLGNLPDLFEEGESRIDQGRTYHLVRTGAGDEGDHGETRMGLAWSLDSGLLVVTTSERAMKLALGAIAAREAFRPKLAGLASLELDMELLERDLYFKREFLFGSPPESAGSRGRISAAMRLELGRLVEVREGVLPPSRTRGAVFDARDAIASGWIPDASELLAELRRGILEPWPESAPRPQFSVAELPSTRAVSAEDRYAVNIETPALPNGAALTEAAELDGWKALLAAQPVAGFGYIVTKSRSRLLAIPWPKERDTGLAALLEATLTRRGARLAPTASAGQARQYLFGPSLPALAFRRAGDFVWIATSAADLQSVPAVSWSHEVVRFSKLNLAAVREEGKRWQRVEGPRSPDRVRPFSDRILGLLGWMKAVSTIEVERRVTSTGFRERLVFDAAPAALPTK